jgi:hypothetical protein
MPFDRKKYPADWNEIRQRILERAGNKCERCGVPNYSVGARDKNGEWWDEKSIHNMNSDCGWALWPDGFPPMIKVVLTVAHLNHDPQDNRDENLAALCQRDHLGHDIRLHTYNAARTRARKAGQAEMITLLEKSNDGH